MTERRPWERELPAMKEGDDDQEPWARQYDEEGKQENNRWYDRFTRFRLMGPDRSLTRLYDDWRESKGRGRSGKPTPSWRRAAVRWKWRQRAEAWDEHQRSLLVAAQEAELEAMRERHIEDSVMLQDVGRKKLLDLAEQEHVAINPTEARIYVTSGQEAERRARGVDDRGSGGGINLNVTSVRLELPKKGSGWKIVDDVVEGEAYEIEGESASVPRLPGDGV